MLILIQLNRLMENQKVRVGEAGGGGGGGSGGEEETSIDFNTDY